MSPKRGRKPTLRNVAEGHAAKPKARAHILARAAEVANRSRYVRAIEREFGKIESGLAEPWDVR